MIVIKVLLVNLPTDHQYERVQPTIDHNGRSHEQSENQMQCVSS